MRAYSISERATEHCAQMTLSNLVQLPGAPDVGTSYHESPTSSKPLSRNQRCFNQFDRKTVCFDGGSEPQPLYRLSGVARNQLWPEVCIAGVGLGRFISPYCDGNQGRNPRATFKAVCGTQTRQDGSLNKYQLDSPIGQKPGIDVAVSSPVPLRETIRKRKPVPGMSTDKGKAIAMDTGDR